MKKLFQVLSSLVLSSMPLVAISCKDQNLNPSSTNNQNPNSNKNRVNLINNKDIQKLIDFYSKNNKIKKEIYVSSQENISNAKIQDLKYAFVYEPLFVFSSPILEGGEYEVLIRDSSESIKKTLSNNWLWTLNNINKFWFLFNPYGDKYKEIEHKENPDKEKEIFNEATKQNSSLIFKIDNIIPKAYRFKIPNLKLSEQIKKEIEEKFKNNSELNSQTNELKIDSSIIEKWDINDKNFEIKLRQSIENKLASLEDYEFDEEKYNVWIKENKNKNKDDDEDDFKPTKDNFSEYIEKFEDKLRNTTSSIYKLITQIKKSKNKKEEFEKLKTNIKSLIESLNSKLKDFVSITKHKAESSSSGSTSPNISITKDKLIKDIENKLKNSNSYSNKEAIYLLYDSNKALRLWKYTIKNGNEEKNFISIIPDLLVFKNKNNIEKQIKDLEQEIQQIRQTEFDKNLKRFIDGLIEDPEEYESINFIFDNFSDSKFFSFKEKNQYNSFLFDALEKINKNGMQIFKYTMRSIDEK